MYDQLRGLFRHVPFTARDFANLAPNIAETLSPRKPEDALVVFWDVLDKQERNRNLDALLALLGFSGGEGNVLNRKTDFAADVNPRTVARWADTAASSVVSYIDENFTTASALVGVRLTKTDTAIEASFTLRANAPMDAPVVTTVGDFKEGTYPIEWNEDDQRGDFSIVLDGVPDYDTHGTFQVDVEWQGVVVPTFDYTIVGAHPMALKLEQSSERVSVIRLG